MSCHGLKRKMFAVVQSRYGPMVTGPPDFFSLLRTESSFLEKRILSRQRQTGGYSLSRRSLYSYLFCLFTYRFLFGKSLIVSDLKVGLLYIMAISAITPISILLAGWASNNKYSLMGAIRAVAQDISYTIPLAITAIAVVVVVGS